MKTYYVKSGTKFGKRFQQRDNVHALAYARGFAKAKGWTTFTVMEVA